MSKKTPPYRNTKSQRFPWWPSGWDSSLPLQGAQVWSLARELRSRMLHTAAKKINLKKKKERMTKPQLGATVSLHLPWRNSYKNILKRLVLYLHISLRPKEREAWEPLRKKMVKRACFVVTHKGSSDDSTQIKKKKTLRKIIGEKYLQIRTASRERHMESTCGAMTRLLSNSIRTRTVKAGLRGP